MRSNTAYLLGAVLNNTTSQERQNQILKVSYLSKKYFIVGFRQSLVVAILSAYVFGVNNSQNHGFVAQKFACEREFHFSRQTSLQLANRTLQGQRESRRRHFLWLEFRLCVQHVFFPNASVLRFTKVLRIRSTSTAVAFATKILYTGKSLKIA